jgi:ABC-type transport system involved in cytochrome bd biosynthesis fused ATPase/permease subunit
MDPQASIAVPTLPSVVWAILISAVVLGPFLVFVWWLNRRDRRRWAREQAERERQRALQQQVWDLEQQIREESLSEEEREWRRHYRQREAEITREARRRLGLPEEEDPS